ncbi:MAG: LamG-like jellyroll fold domain-containing protein [Planctomycetia bacterium]|nr:LamG-like jellyroll fold domain-containing protein [Planctomycetia bacterium]
MKHSHSNRTEIFDLSNAVPSETNSPLVSRRRFLATSAVAASALLFVPRNAFADSPSDVVLRAVVMSDVHYSGNPRAAEVSRFETALQFMNDYSASQPYPHFDALVVAGDMSNNGTENQIGPFRDSMDKCLKPATKRILCMGNHEHWGGNPQLWERVFGMPANKRTEINGFQFLTLSAERGTMKDGDYSYAIDWLKKELNAATAADPNKPIFLVQHYHVANTVYGSCPPDNWGVNDLVELLPNYPRVIDFSGHSHYPINDPRSAWQGTFSAFGTGTLSYYEMTGGKYNRFPAGHRNAAEFYVMEVHRDNSVVLKPYDGHTKTWFDNVYIVAEPGNAKRYLYTDARYETTKAPEWQEGAQVVVGDLTPGGGTFRFPQAQYEGHDNIVHSYRLDFERKVSPTRDASEEKWVPAAAQYEWSGYYFKDIPESMSVSTAALADDTDYRLSITALNCFGKESMGTLHAEFKTPKDPNECVDRNAARPQANILDVQFSESGPTNTPMNKRPTQKTVEVYGAPRFVSDVALGCVVAQFDGAKDFCKVKFSAQEYARMSGSITMAAKFKIDAFSDKNSDVFANTEGGGYCFEINAPARELEFWCHVAGRYQIVRAPISSGEYISAFGVYDGSHVILYINGREAARVAASGQITYTSREAARAFCIGSDISSRGDGSNFFKGTVAHARLYGWALTPEQIKNLSE